GGGDHGHVVVLLPGPLAQEGAQRAGMQPQVLGGLDQGPARLAVAGLGDRAVLAVLCMPIEKCSAVPTEKCSARVHGIRHLVRLTRASRPSSPLDISNSILL